MSRSPSTLSRLLGSPWTWIAVGLLARLWHVASLGNRYYFGDTTEYEIAALRLLHLGSFEGNSVRAPAYPVLLAFSFWLGGEQNYLIARGLQLVLSAVHMLLGVRLATRIGGPAAGAVAAPALALAPSIVFIAGLLYPTLLYSTLLLAVTCVAWELAERPRARTGVLLGVLLAAGWLTDMVFIAPASAVLAWLVAVSRPRARVLAGVLGIAVLVAGLLVAPYMLQGQRAGQPRAFMGKAQAVLHFARTDTLISQGRWIRMPFGTPFEALPPRAFAQRELQLMRAEPLRYAHDYMFEFLHFFQPIPDRVTTKNRFNTRVILWAGAVWFTFVLLLSVYGFLRGDAPWRGRSLLAVVVLATAAFYAFFFTQTRYRIPVEPELLVLAAFGVARLFPQLTRLLGDAARAPRESAGG